MSFFSFSHNHNLVNLIDMKKLLLPVIGAFLFLAACTDSTTSSVEGKKAEFFVRGNCEMCKERIEDVAKSVEGVQSAEWDVKTSVMHLVYDSTKIEEMTVHQAVAAAGHGTDHVQMDQKAHDALPDCCQFKEEVKQEN